MTTFRPKLWTGVSAAILLAATAGCSGEAGEKGEHPAANTAAAVGESGEGGPGSKPDTGEKGALAAYADTPAQSRPALHLAHLLGFLLIAQKQTEGPEAAAALVGQGMTEVFDAEPDVFKAAGVNEAVLRRAAQTGAPADISAAIATVEAGQPKAGGDPAAVLKGMVDIAGGLYAGVMVDGSVDPIEYQHSYGAALSAQALAQHSKDARVQAAKAELDKLVAMWPSATPPAKPNPANQVAAQTSRVELALS